MSYEQLEQPENKQFTTAEIIDMLVRVDSRIDPTHLHVIHQPNSLVLIDTTLNKVWKVIGKRKNGKLIPNYKSIIIENSQLLLLKKFGINVPDFELLEDELFMQYDFIINSLPIVPQSASWVPIASFISRLHKQLRLIPEDTIPSQNFTTTSRCVQNFIELSLPNILQSSDKLLLGVEAIAQKLFLKLPNLANFPVQCIWGDLKYEHVIHGVDQAYFIIDPTLAVDTVYSDLGKYINRSLLMNPELDWIDFIETYNNEAAEKIIHQQMILYMLLDAYNLLSVRLVARRPKDEIQAICRHILLLNKLY